MKITLNQQECQNVKVALLSLAKQANTNEQAMTALLILGRKFDWVEEKEEKKK